jgi:hypothetical protein
LKDIIISLNGLSRNAIFFWEFDFPGGFHHIHYLWPEPVYTIIQEHGRQTRKNNKIFLTVATTILLKSGLVWWVNLGPGHLGAKTRLGWKTNRGRKNSVWLGQKPGCNPLTFFNQNDVVLIFLKKNWPRRPGQNPEPEP